MLFLLPPPSYFSPFLTFLAFIIRASSFSSLSIAREGVLFLLLSQMISHILYSAIFTVSWVYSAIFVTDDFSTFQFFYISVVPDTWRCLWLKRGASASKSKYYFMITLLTHSLFCLHLIFEVQYRNFYQWPSSYFRSSRFQKRDKWQTKKVSKIRVSVETKTSRPLSMNVYNMNKLYSFQAIRTSF